MARNAQAVGGRATGTPSLGPCLACGFATTRELCHFCAKTEALIRRRRCVFCGKKVTSERTDRVESRCAECLSRGIRASNGTQFLLRRDARIRAALRSAA